MQLCSLYDDFSCAKLNFIGAFLQFHSLVFMLNQETKTLPSEHLYLGICAEYLFSDQFRKLCKAP